MLRACVAVLLCVPFASCLATCDTYKDVTTVGDLGVSMDNKPYGSQTKCFYIGCEGKFVHFETIDGDWDLAVCEQPNPGKWDYPKGSSLTMYINASQSGDTYSGIRSFYQNPNPGSFVLAGPVYVEYITGYCDYGPVDFAFTFVCSVATAVPPTPAPVTRAPGVGYLCDEETELPSSGNVNFSRDSFNTYTQCWYLGCDEVVVLEVTSMYLVYEATLEMYSSSGNGGYTGARTLSGSITSSTEIVLTGPVFLQFRSSGNMIEGTSKFYLQYQCVKATSAPPTHAPPTLAPPTPAPPTLAPTPAPPTPAPPTPAPPTPAPPTPAPPTLAPPTPAPPTLAPTPAPPTLAPPTPAPVTHAPDTSAPTPAPTDARDIPNACRTNPCGPGQHCIDLSNSSDPGAGFLCSCAGDDIVALRKPATCTADGGSNHTWLYIVVPVGVACILGLAFAVAKFTGVCKTKPSNSSSSEEVLLEDDMCTDQMDPITTLIS